MTEKVCLIGSPSCGKTTLAADVFAAFKKAGYNCELVPEWIRRDISRHGAMENIFEQFRTLMKHREEEMNFPPQVEYLIVDSGCLTPFFYAAIYARRDSPRDRLAIADMYSYLLTDLYTKRYSHIFFLPRIFTDQIGASFQDGIRYQTQEEIDTLEEFMRLFFTKVHRMENIHVLDCSLEKRVEEIKRIVLGMEVDK